MFPYLLKEIKEVGWRLRVENWAAMLLDILVFVNKNFVQDAENRKTKYNRITIIYNYKNLQ